MCGIAGIFNINGEPVQSAILRGMTDAIAHRGPDSEGFYIDSFVGLGHRRLSIIDLSSAGHQPMISADGHYAIVYNGEVYNFKELRKELELAGYSFNSHSDTEVVLTAYIAWGEKCLDYFNGMFAFAVWDKRKQELFLARDRYGIKPLYYTMINNVFLFGSEVKAILKHPAYRIDLDREALLEYLTFQNFFTDRTLFKNIRLFPAGCHTRIQLGKAQMGDIVEYWDYDFSEPQTARDDNEYLEELDRLFQQAVQRQLVSDVELGAYLSGGLDSGSITALAAKSLPYIKTFTCGFDLHSISGLETTFDEREKAEYMSYLFKTEHYEQVLKSGDMQRCIPKLVWHLEEPRVGQCYPNFYISQLASKFVKVVLTGTGGDELFGGYPWRYYRAVNNSDFNDYIDKYYLFWQRLIPNRVIQKVFTPIWPDVKGVWTQDIFRNVFKKHASELTRPEDYIQHSLYLEAKTFLNGLLIVEDKLSMAHSLETRVPFLDNDLVEFAMRLPARHKVANLENAVRINENEPGKKLSKIFLKTNDGKVLLRNMLCRHVPKKVTEYVKQGFSAPDASWFKGDSIRYVKERLYTKSARIYEYLDRETVVGLMEDHMDGRTNRRLLIWSLLNLEEWFSRYL